MAPEILNKEQEQTQQQEQQPQVQQEQQVQKEIEILRKKIITEGVIQQIYRKFRKTITNLHNGSATDTVIQHLMQTKMTKNYLYYVIKAYVAATYFKTSKVVKLIKHLLTKLERKVSVLFDEKLFFTTLLAQILLQRNEKLITYIQAYYLHVLIKNLISSSDKQKIREIEMMLDLTTLKEKAIVILENKFLNKFEQELVSEVEEKEENTKTEKINFENELKKEVKVIKMRRKTLRNYIINTIKQEIENEANFDKDYIINLKKEFKNKRLARIYMLFKQLLKEQGKASESDFTALFELLKSTVIKVDEISIYLAQTQKQQ